jgi:hypothetical protein
MDYPKNSRLTIHSREQLAKMVVERGAARRRPLQRSQRQCQDRGQVGPPLQGAGAGPGWA